MKANYIKYLSSKFCASKGMSLIMKNKKRFVLFSVVLATVMFYGIFILFFRTSLTVYSADRFYDPGQEHGFASQDGVYHTEGSGFLYFFDYNTQQDVIVCNKPNCPHKTWNSDTLDEQRCNAYLNGSSSGFVYDDSLYILNVNMPQQNVAIIRSGLDRTGRREIAKFDCYLILPYLVRDQFLYMTGQFMCMEKDDDGMEIPSGEFESWLFQLDLRTGAVNILTERRKHYNGGLFIIGYYGDKIYCKEEFFEVKFDGTNFEEAKRQVVFYTYDVSTSLFEPLFNSLGRHAFEDACLYGNKMIGTESFDLEWNNNSYVFRNTQVTICDLDTGEIRQLATVHRFICCVDGKIFYALEREKDEYYFYDIESGIITELSQMTMDNIHIRGDYGNYLCVIKTDTITRIGKIYMILKEDFYKGRDKYIPLVF